MDHVTVYGRPGRYGGWPANSGIWKFGTKELVVGFNEGKLDTSLSGMHPMDMGTQVWTQARSTDGGLTWGMLEHAIRTPDVSSEESCPGTIDFSATKFAMRFLRSSDGNLAASWFFLTDDKAKTWNGPYRLPDLGERGPDGEGGTVARTDYQVLGPAELLAFVAAVKPDGMAAHAMCVHTDDGGQTWTRRGWIGPEPDGRSYMPSTVRIADGRIIAALRRREGDEVFIDLYESTDSGFEWEHVGTPVESLGGSNGNPPALLLLKGGERMVLTYAWRGENPAIRARISDDFGRTWSEERELRGSSTGPTPANPDLGYTRNALRSDGRIVTCYYYNEPPDDGRDPGDGERSIQATIWHPDK